MYVWLSAVVESTVGSDGGGLSEGSPVVVVSTVGSDGGGLSEGSPVVVVSTVGSDEMASLLLRDGRTKDASACSTSHSVCSLFATRAPAEPPAAPTTVANTGPFRANIGLIDAS